MNERIGVWIVGAAGDVAVTTFLGACALARGLSGPTGLVSAREPYASLPLVDFPQLVFGGHEAREPDPLQAARKLAQGGVVPAALVEALEDELRAYAQRIKPGVHFGAGSVVRELSSEQTHARSAGGTRAGVELLRADLREFRAAHELARVIVVLLASTEPLPEALPELESAEAFLAALEEDAPLPASSLYAAAAFLEGCPWINFTPSLGAQPAGLLELAERQGVPHMGQDGKTGQTLVRTALAPMFRDRNLNVLSWSGFNILGNRDGAVLEEPGANAAKTEGKDSVLGQILGEGLGSSLTRIDYVPSLADWKTAWDHVHFEGFLGTRMRLELSWQGADSALAAPLVLDLTRFLDLAARRGRSGLQPGLACFFKTPLGVEEYSFPAQMAALERYAAELAE